VDDVRLPGMLHSAILRSPYAHARIVSIDTMAAEAHPKVKAVITGATLENPATGVDADAVLTTTQAVLATEQGPVSRARKWRSLVAEDRYLSARDALRADRRRVRAAARRRGRPHSAGPGRAADPRRQGRQGRQPRLRLGSRRQGSHRPGVRVGGCRCGAGDAVSEGAPRRRWRRAATVADLDPVTGKLTVWSTHAGTARATARCTRLVAGLPEHKIRIHLAGHRRRFRQQGADLSRIRVRGGRLDHHREAGEVDGGPLGEPDEHGRSPATYHMRGEIAATKDGKNPGAAGRRARRPRRVSNGTAQPTNYPGPVFFHIFTGSYDLKSRALQGNRRLHQQGTRRRRLRLLVPGGRGGLPGGAARRHAGRRTGHRPGGVADAEPVAAGAVPVHLPDRLGVRLPATIRRTLRLAMDMAGYPELRAEQAAKTGAGRVDGHRHQLLHRGPSAPDRASTWTFWVLAWPTEVELRVHPTARRCCVSPCRARDRATRRRSHRS